MIACQLFADDVVLLALSDSDLQRTLGRFDANRPSGSETENSGLFLSELFLPQAKEFGVLLMNDGVRDGKAV